jgi:acetyl/propionyl-CoA carboxylase alpha subunit
MRDRAQRHVPGDRLSHRPAEAEKAFGNSGVYIEKFIENPHHIEFQILADTRGNMIHLGERDCSIQRRNQKLVEETPSPLIENKFRDLRKKMGKAAVRIAEEAGYSNAGTVEFIVDGPGPVLLPRGQQADSGGASDHRGGHRRRPGQAADPHRHG